MISWRYNCPSIQATCNIPTCAFQNNCCWEKKNVVTWKLSSPFWWTAWLAKCILGIFFFTFVACTPRSSIPLSIPGTVGDGVRQVFGLELSRGIESFLYSMFFHMKCRWIWLDPCSKWGNSVKWRVNSAVFTTLTKYRCQSVLPRLKLDNPESIYIYTRAPPTHFVAFKIQTPITRNIKHTHFVASKMRGLIRPSNPYS